MRVAGFLSSLATISFLTAWTRNAVASPNAAHADRPVQSTSAFEPEFQSARKWQKREDPEPFKLRDSVDSPSLPDEEYVKLLRYSLLFYEAQRSGKLPPNKRVAWRNDSALQDGSDHGVDLSGGYFDAGDYMKFIFPMTFAMTEICWGGLQFYEGYRLSNQTKYLDEMVRWGMDWLIKAHPNNNTLFVQVGLDSVDNNYWGPDTTIPGPRPSFMVTNTSPGTDVIADAAAAFSACSMLYRDKLNDSSYANTLAGHADSLFHMAETSTPQQVYQKVVKEVECCYPSSGYVDELAWAAAWMYRRTGDATYKTKAGAYMNQLSSLGVSLTDVVTWDSKMGFVPLVMAEATLGTPDNDQWIQQAIQYADAMASPSKPCKFTRGGLYWCDESKSNSMVLAANAAFGLRLLTTLLDTPTANLSEKYSDHIGRYNNFALGQTDYILGDNPLKTPYIVGVHPNSPVNPHSALASGGNNVGTINTYPAKEAYVLYGALVGGPDGRDRFEDRRDDWEQSEVALDYNAPFTGLVAYQVIWSHQSPPYVVIPPGRPDLPTLINGMEVWQVILIAVAVVFVLLGICAAFCYCKRVEIRSWLADRKERKRQQQYKLEEFEKRTVAICEADATERRRGSNENNVPILK
ncbi:hypothetical protein DFQ26_001310 [Actinomortierella ambigua]|nr:hypothetical protein DFQ26_001310 [Actinomortierella ambigua]